MLTADAALTADVAAERAGPLLRAEQIRKSFAGVEVLHGVDLTVEAGSVLALLGENGAGKSTLVKILVGDHDPDEGRLLMEGEEITDLDPAAAKQLGIGMIFQELTDAPPLTVAENVCLGAWPNRRGWVSWREARRRTRAVLAELGARIEPSRTVASLRVGERQIVEIARALLGSTRCLILDEPTAALSASETERLFEAVSKLRASGVGMVYITHRLDEVQAVADRVQVLRDGATAAEGSVTDFDRERLVTAMVGHPVADGREGVQSRSLPSSGDPVLKLVGATSTGAFTDVSLALHPGEILALYGKIGAGCEEVAEAIFGARTLAAGGIQLDGRPFHPRRPADAIGAGIGLLPGDRQRVGGFMIRSVAENLCAPSWAKISSAGFITRGREARAYQRWHDALRIKSRDDPAQRLVTLSGGNQQKVLLGRWLERDVRVLVLVEPTRGVDVGAREEIYDVIREMTASGTAVLLTSSDHEEVLQLADRVVVMTRGQITKRAERAGLTSTELVASAGGRHD